MHTPVAILHHWCIHNGMQELVVLALLLRRHYLYTPTSIQQTGLSSERMEGGEGRVRVGGPGGGAHLPDTSGSNVIIQQIAESSEGRSLEDVGVYLGEKRLLCEVAVLVHIFSTLYADGVVLSWVQPAQVKIPQPITSFRKTGELLSGRLNRWGKSVDIFLHFINTSQDTTGGQLRLRVSDTVSIVPTHSG